ncbi:SUMF1/EgtB/PvdO family nonheme iron enzyme [Brasilonema sp. CT11]|nr:SUMF1/EgtB/PvdO family nonheme iron enzyme [Brasilonema sp. CT11]
MNMSGEQQKILLLAALPHNLQYLHLNREIRDIKEAIKQSVKRDSFQIEIRTAVRPRDIRIALAEEMPQIVHFCGHGMENGSLVLEDHEGNHKPVLPKALAALFSLYRDCVKCVLLNACYSALPAEAISKHINYVIGMEQPIDDRSAIVFAGGFYDGLGYNNINNKDVIQRAFDEGIVAIELENFSQGTIPYLWKLGVAQGEKSSHEGEKSSQKVVPVIERKFSPQTPTFEGEKSSQKVEPVIASTSSPQTPTFEFDIVTVNAQGREIKPEKRQAQYYVENLGKNITLEMVDIPGGKFIMGSPEAEGYDHERPQHEVTVQPFFMGKYPITQAQWRAVVALPRVNRKLKPDPSHFKGDDYPVECVSWYDVVEFCARLSKKTGKDYRLPSEAEWEYACRAGTTTPFHFGETLTDKLANYCASETFANEPKGKYRQKTTVVGTFSPNAFGLYDIHGNVWEWCEDTWQKNYQGAPTDGSSWNDNYFLRVLRGGSWYNYPDYCRSAIRGRFYIGGDANNFGFRVFCAVPARTQ